MSAIASCLKILRETNARANDRDKLQLEAAALILGEKTSTISSVHCSISHVDGTYFHGCFQLDAEQKLIFHIGRLDKDNKSI